MIENTDCGVSINVSVIQLMQPNFLQVLNTALDESGLSPERIHLEITESVFAQDLTVLKYQVEQIQALGIRVSIDDFGTGFSSLSHLQNLGVDAVKIDKSFVWDIDEGGLAIIQATLHIARQLGCEIVAEGIETEQQYLRLKELGVKYMQGYYFAKPKPISIVSTYNNEMAQRPA